jgi:hypothetical protein
MNYRIKSLALILFISGCNAKPSAEIEIKENLSRSSLLILRWNNSYCIESNSLEFNLLRSQLGLANAVSFDLPDQVQMSIIHLDARGLPSLECDPRHWMTKWYSVYYPNEDGYSAVHLGDLGNGLIYFDSDLSIDLAIKIAKKKKGLYKLPDPWGKPIEAEVKNSELGGR